MIISELVAKLGFQTDDAPLKKIERSIDRIRVRLEILAGYEIAKRFASMTESFAEWGQGLQVAAQNVGMTVESMQKLEYAAEKAGVGQEELVHSLAILSRHLYDAKNGSEEAMLAFHRLHIEPAQVMAFNNASDALMAVSDAMAAIPNPVDRAAQSQEVLGRAGFRMVSFLSQGSGAINNMGGELKKLGLVLTSGQVQSLTNLNHTFQEFFHVIKAIGAEIASTLGPVVELAVHAFEQFYDANRKLINSEIRNFLLKVAYGFGFILGVVHGLYVDYEYLLGLFGKKGQGLAILAEIMAAVVGFKLFMVVGQKVYSLVTTISGAVRGLVTAFAEMGGLTGVIAGFVEWFFWLSGAAVMLGSVIFLVHDLYAFLTGNKLWATGIVDFIDNWRFLHQLMTGVKIEFQDFIDLVKHLSEVSGFTAFLDRISELATQLKYIVELIWKLAAPSVGKLVAAIFTPDTPRTLGAAPEDLPHGGKSQWERAGEETDAYYANKAAASRENDKSFVGPTRDMMMPNGMGVLSRAVGAMQNQANAAIMGSDFVQSQLASSPGGGGQSFQISGDQNNDYHIVINTQPGQNARQIADEVLSQVKAALKQEKDNTARSVGTVVSH